jgi:hypothetical protein
MAGVDADEAGQVDGDGFGLERAHGRAVLFRKWNEGRPKQDGRFARCGRSLNSRAICWRA